MGGRRFPKKLSTFRIIILGFAAVILAGTVVLMLPAAVRSGNRPTFECALFTATSAVCVTGLIVKDTASYWSAFGQAVILLLIQIGGLGVVTVAVLISIISGKKISLLQRSMLQDSISAHQVGGIVRLVSFIFRTAMIIELTGALLMLPTFCRHYGLSGIWMSVFHSISAFCNAGFDIMGDKTAPFSSLTAFQSHLGIILPICFLIAAGGIGFLTWDDIATKKWRFRQYRMQTKTVLTTTAVLIIVPMLFLFFRDFSAYPLKERLCLSLFQSVTPRTAGFNTADLTAMKSTGRMLLIALMLIGGSPGSTAGGMKTTTAAVMTANALSVFRKKRNVRMFGRRLEESTVRSAAALMMMYLLLTLTGTAAIMIAEDLPAGACLFETASAIGTVGLTLGITPSLSLTSHIILIFLMFFGRVGGLTLMYAAIPNKTVEIAQCPVEKITVG